MLELDYRPVGDAEGEPRPPLYPERVKAFELACGSYAWELQASLAGAGAGAGGVG